MDDSRTYIGNICYFATKKIKQKKLSWAKYRYFHLRHQNVHDSHTYIGNICYFTTKKIKQCDVSEQDIEFCLYALPLVFSGYIKAVN